MNARRIEPAQLASESTKTPGNGLLCLSIDLEVGVQDQRIHSFAAVRGDNGASFVFQNGNLRDALKKLDASSGPMAFLLGHNIIAFDAPHLAAAQPDLRLLKLPLVDTLQLNPLAFPHNSYHHLVKHYKDGQLRRGSLNDPELDARLALEVFSDQLRAFEELQHSAPDLLLAWHWLTTIADVKSGLNAVFMRVRRCLRPTDTQAHATIQRLLSGQACQTHGRALLTDSRQHGWPLAYVSRQDIQAILKSIRRLERKKQGDGEVIATSGEILSEETDGTFERDSATDDTRVRTAIAWLEEATLLTREENRAQVFLSSLRVSSLAEAEKIG